MTDSYVALDLETTGLNPREDKIIEIGAVRVIKGKPAEKFHMFVNPHTVISAEITSLTGITGEMVKEGAECRDAIEQIIEFCEDEVLLGHNLMFDYSFLKRNAVNCDLKFEKQGIDTLKIARKYLDELPSRSLEYLCAYYQLDNSIRHRAYEDALCAAKLYERLKTSFLKNEPGEESDKVFEPSPLIYKVKKDVPITGRQKVYLKDLIKYHKIELDAEIDYLTKSEASRLIDQILSRYGKIKNIFL